MFKRITSALGGLVLLLAAALPAFAASVPVMCGPAATSPTGCVPVVSTVGAQALPDLNAVINNVNSTITPASMATFAGLRNYLDNGAMAIAQRGTSSATGAINGAACTNATYFADRWCVDTNVAVGAGFGQVITATPSPPAGYQNSQKVFRNSGALTQPVCAIQEVETNRSIQLAGQTVTFSAQMQALAGLSADNGNAANLFIIYGTGTDQGLGTWTASPAITPAWTGINSSITKALTLTTAWAQYSVTGTIPTTATEVGVMLCFTPTATGAGTTDGFAFTGAQLEVGNAPSTFEFRPFAVDLQLANRYYYRFAEKAATYALPAFCQATGANTNSCTLNLPQPMWKIPTIAITTAGTFKVNIAGSLTTIASPTAGNCDLTACIVTAANTNTAGQVEQLTGAAGGTGVWEVSADF